MVDERASGQQPPPQQPSASDMLQAQLALIVQCFVAGTTRIYPKLRPNVLLPVLAAVVGSCIMRTMAGDPGQRRKLRVSICKAFVAGCKAVPLEDNIAHPQPADQSRDARMMSSTAPIRRVN